ncbi:MAG: hypothetical protein FWC32_10400 [Firmicutes bacterium]|nr:hypothetical protein [Bacillota bacterium]
MTRHMFAGGMTPIGFVDFFDQVMPLKTAQKRYFLKGASGTGKSTFIKKIAAQFEAAKINIDFYHCANDVTGIDGMAVKEHGFCIIDATRPHSHDPEIPAAIDEIIDFAQFLDREKVTKHLDEIRQLLYSKEESYAMAQKLLASAKNVSSSTIPTNEKLRIKKIAREYVSIFRKKHRAGTNRNMFLAAITPDGIKNFADTTLGMYKVYGVFPQAEAGVFLAEVKECAVAIGINTESFYCPLEPEKIIHLILPDEGAAMATLGGHFGYTGNVYTKVDLMHIAPLQSDKASDKILGAVIDAMKLARISHEKLEEIYVSAMDFTKVDELLLYRPTRNVSISPNNHKISTFIALEIARSS